MDFIKELKLKKLDSFCQLILFDEKGLILNSCDSLFSTSEFKNEEIYTLFPIIEGVFSSLSEIQKDQTISFRKIPTPTSFLDGIYDLELAPFSNNSYSGFLLTILDFTKNYQELLKFQQERNDCFIKMDLLETEIKKYKSNNK